MIDKKLLMSREDFDNWYHDHPSFIRMNPTNGSDPDKFPCVVCWKTVYGDIHGIDNRFYDFVYLDDFVC